MLATLIPLFNSKMEVCAYSVFAQRENYLLNPSLLGTGSLDTATDILGLEVIESMGVGTLAGGKNVFVEVNDISIFSEINFSVPGMLVFLIDPRIKPEPLYLKRIRELKAKKYNFAIRKLPIEKFDYYAPILKEMDYILLDQKKLEMDIAKKYLSEEYPKLNLCAINVDSKEDYNSLTGKGGYCLYEGDFFRMPAVSKIDKISPLKMTYIELLNLVNKPDFDLTDAAEIIGKDTILVIDMLEIVNKIARNSRVTSIKVATAMLGQKELKRWASTVATKSLCADKPSEITRVSLIRAKFAENLAEFFELGESASELFLMGLFSVIDVILDKSMEDALKMVNLSEDINSALLERKGRLAPVLNFILSYENADWQEISRVMALSGIEVSNVYKAYVKALIWYRDMFL